MTFYTSELSSAIAAKLTAALEARKAAILKDAGGPIRHAAVQVAWPLVIDEMPNLAAAAVEAVREQFGAMTLNDLLDWLGRR